jgi:MraZ protein
MLRVRCQAPATLDAKGRLALPAALRRALVKFEVDSLVLTFHKGAIWGWTPEDFETTVEQPMATRDPFAQDVMDFAHALLAPAQDVDVDGQGRIRVPPPLRDLAGLDRDVMVNSLLNRVEIWDREAWDARFSQSLDRARLASGMPRSDNQGPGR